MNEFPWYKSPILIAQVVAFASAALAFFNIQLDFDVGETVAAIFAGIGALVALYTFFKRLLRPSPNLTATADREEKKLVKEGKIPEAVASQKVVNQIKQERS